MSARHQPMARRGMSSTCLSAAERLALARVGWPPARVATSQAPSRTAERVGDAASDPPAASDLARLEPAESELPAGSWLARVYFAGGRHPARWNGFRHVGPLDGRFDHHYRGAAGVPGRQGRGILYAASSADLCLGEVFEATRCVDAQAGQPCLAVFSLRRALRLLDLRGDWLQRHGLAAMLQFGPHATAQRWARAFYAAWPQLHGLTYASAVDAEASAYALFERAAAALPAQPTCRRALADPALQALLEAARSRLGYHRAGHHGP